MKKLYKRNDDKKRNEAVEEKSETMRYLRAIMIDEFITNVHLRHRKRFNLC